MAHLRIRQDPHCRLRLPELVVDVDQGLDRGLGGRLELQLLGHSDNAIDCCLYHPKLIAHCAHVQPSALRS